ncbi:MAG: phage tail tip lysozyme, partial [Eubacteriales bacterium]
MKKLIVLTLASALLLTMPLPTLVTAAEDSSVSGQVASEEIPLTYSKQGTGAATVERKIYDFLKNRMNFNDATTCGILANIFVECSFNPNGSYIEASGATSYGICQWNNTRLANLKSFCETNGYDYTTVEGQLEFMCYELTKGEEKNAYRMMQGISNDVSGAYTAGYNWARYYERCSSASYPKRGTLASTDFWSIYGRYLPIGLNVPYYPVTKEVGSLQAAVAICESYYKGYPAGSETVIEAVLNGDLSGYTEEAVDLSVLFTHLNKGDPVILRDGSGKCSVIYAYDGDATVLKASGFRLLTPSASESGDLAYDTLDVWLTYHSDSVCLVRTSDSVALDILPVENRRLSVQGWVCPVNLPLGESFPVTGRLLSTSPVVSVSLTLSTEEETLGTVEGTPDGTTYDLSDLPSDIDFSALAEGTYTLTLAATDEKGAQLTVEKTFTVSDMPISGRIVEDYADNVGEIGDALPGIYRVTAHSGLNMREEP